MLSYSETLEEMSNFCTGCMHNDRCEVCVYPTIVKALNVAQEMEQKIEEIKKSNSVDYGPIYSFETHQGAKWMQRDKYPNLELMEYQFKLALSKNKTYQQKRPENHRPHITAEMFIQSWPSTMLAFDVDEEGKPYCGGDAFTDAYTVVMHEENTDMYLVFVGNEPCYMINEATQDFLNDLKKHNMGSRSYAHKHYDFSDVSKRMTMEKEGVFTALEAKREKE